MTTKPPRRLVGETEPTFKQRIVEMMNALIREHAFPFARADAEQSVRVGTRRHLFCDGLLWKVASQKAVCEMELKRPHVEAADFDLVNNAAQKANAVGAPFFLTWNVRDLWLWRTFEDHVPLLQRDCKQWNGIVDVDDVDDLRDSHWARINAFLLELLTELDRLYNRQEPFEGLAVDEIFVRKLASVVESNHRIYAALISERCDADTRYYQALRHWCADHGWTTFLPVDMRKADRTTFDVLGRLAVFLLMNRVIFYKLVRTQHGFLEPMSFEGVKTGAQFDRRLRRYFEAVLHINFDTIFASDVFDQLIVPDASVDRLERFVGDLDKYDFQTLSFEILGRVYETLIPERDRHQLGQYFTPPTTVDLINAFCIQRPDDVVLDPACGAGTFLVRAHERLNHLKPRSHRTLLEQLWGFEVARYPAHIATINLVLPDLRERENFPYVICSNAFTVTPEAAEFRVPAHSQLRYPTRPLSDSTEVMVTVPMFDAVVGNPPYIERRNLRATDKEIIARTIKSDWALRKFTAAADVFVYFFVHAARFLKEGGRLGFVTSNGWLDHQYGVDLQRFFFEHFRILSIIESRVERSFSQAAINTAITIVERCSDASAREQNIIRFVSLRRPLADLLGDDPLLGSSQFAERIMAMNERSADEDWVVYPVPQQEVREAGLDEDGRFRGAPLGSVYLRAPHIYFTILRRGESVFTRLKTLATGVLGTKTGCDEFFVRTQEDVRALGLEERFTRPSFWSPTNARGFKLARAGAPHRLVLIAASIRQLRGTNAARYISWAERKGLHARGENERRAKTRGRWYDLSEQVQRGTIAFAKTYDQRHAVFWNPQRCVLGARFASFAPHDDVDEEVLLALLNSSVTALFVEIHGRRSLGQGALDFAVYEARTLPVVDPRNLPPETADALKAAYRRLIKRDPLPVTREVHAADKQALDALVFDVLGLSAAEREEVIGALVAKTTGRRRKARSVENRGGGGPRAVSDDDVLEYGLSDALSEVGLRRFPADFLSGPARTVSVPEAANANRVPRIEAMMGEGVLVWPDGRQVEFEHIEAAQLVGILLSLGWSGPIGVPVERRDAERTLRALDAYVSLCCARFDESIREVAENGAQMKRVAGLFPPKLGEVMFNGVGGGALGVSDASAT